jgi:uncharacterized protein YfaS (alpha-2-macroglobulin family)
MARKHASTMKQQLVLLYLGLTTFALAFAMGPAGPPPGRGPAPGSQDDYEQLRGEAERDFERGSFTLAMRGYEQAANLELPEEQRAWVDFRLADTGWRALAASENPDDSALDAALKRLEAFIERYRRPEQRDALWALALESRGDSAWLRPQVRDQATAWRHYQEALEFWAASAEIERARGRYLELVWKMIEPPQNNEWQRRNYAGSLQEAHLLGAQKIALTAEDRARANYYVALRGERQTGDERTHGRTRAAFEAVLALGRSTSVYAEALYAYGVWLEERGTLLVDSQRGTHTEADCISALVIYRRLMEEFREGTHEHWRDARERIRNIEGDEVSLSVGQVFLPGSKIGFGLRWRNVAVVHIALHPVDLTQAVDLVSESRDGGDYLASIDLADHRPSLEWDLETGDDGRHAWGSRSELLERGLAPGAYVLQARAGAASSRELVLVSDAALVVKSEPGRCLTWFADVFTGEPIVEARVRCWTRDNRRTPWRVESTRSDGDGLASFELSESSGRQRQYFIAASAGGRQAFALAWEPWRDSLQDRWLIYVNADRAAYRPGQEVFWKFSARRESAGSFKTPAGEKLQWELWGPRGDVHAKAVVRLNEFGSAAGSLVPAADWPLGEYELRFFEPGRGDQERGRFHGSGTLMRLEEYKLPEFQVRVERARDEDGQPRSFRMGDVVELTVAADYYFGGPVAEASAELRVFRKPFYKTHSRSRDFPWFYSESDGFAPWQWGQGELVQQETLRTDADGRLSVRIETSSADSQDYEYTVEARVTDSSRREVTGEGGLRVTHQGWFANLTAEHAIHAPGQSAEVELAISDADDRPLARSGEATLLRLVWREVWLDPLGQRIAGAELAALRGRAGIFPPPVELGQRPWRQHSASYEERALESTQLMSDELGRASWRVQLPEAGHYLVRFAGQDGQGAAVQAELPLRCADSSTTELDLRTDAPRLVLDRDTFREGEPGLVMITTPASGRWVLFSIETDELLEYRVLRVEGTVKLLRLDVDRRWIPNVVLALAGFHQGRATLDSHEVIVPPHEHFLEVDVVLDPVTARPGGAGALQVRVTDHAGRPVEAELTLSLVDASVAAIQEDYAGDPREFFYGQKRVHAVLTATSMNQRAYAHMVESKEGQLVDARLAAWTQSEVGTRGGESLGLEAESLRALQGLGYLGGPADRSSLTRAGGAAGADDFFVGHGQSLQAGLAFAPAGKAAVGGAVHVEVRSDFRETALWRPQVVTDVEGRAQVEFTYPDNLTRWTATVRAQSRSADFGTDAAESATRLPLLVRLQAPRFFVEGDEAVISLNLDNRTDEPLRAHPTLAVEGLELLGFVADGDLRQEAPREVLLPAQGGLRLDWKVRVHAAGTARFRAEVTGADHGDAILQELPIHAHGIEALIVKAGRFDGEGIEFDVELPAQRGAASTEFQVQVTPSLAVTLLDALPYLVDYPYGCTEQTLSRFVPTAVVTHTLEQLGLDPKEALGRVYGGIELDHTDVTQRKTDAGLQQLERATREGLARLYDLQHGDGSWSWWKHGEGDRFMTAYVVWGLSLARRAGVAVDEARLAAGARWLGKQLVTARQDPNLQAWMLHAHTAWLGREGGEQREFAESAFEELLGRRLTVGAYGRALLGLSAVALGRTQEARLVAENLIDGALRDSAPDASIVPLGGLAAGTQSPRAHWGEDGLGYRWSDGGVEATAFALRALVAVDPGHELVEPAADWLIANRRGAQWSNTKTTAIVVLALSDYLVAKGQLARSVSYEVSVNGSVIGTRALGGADLLSAPASFRVPAELVRDGDNRVRVRRLSGEGPLYFSARASFFSREEPIPPRGNELFVRRQYYKLVARPTLLRGSVYDRVLMGSGDEVTSGERIEVVLTVEAKNHLEYLMFEDLKPAGFEATQVKSGESLRARELRRDELQHRLGGEGESESGRGRREHGERFELGYTGRERQLHQELRDRKVAFFLDQCPEGLWEIRYDLRAEAPGVFHALPLLGSAMYVPEIAANGAELIVRVLDREDV